jgi:hypothetical protein
VRLLRRRKHKLRRLKLSKYELDSSKISIHCISIRCSVELKDIGVWRLIGDNY